MLRRWSNFFRLIKQMRCPFCGRVKTLNRHSFLYGNNPHKPQGQVCRGQRVCCSNRGKRGGCGGSFSVCFGEFLPRHTVTATILWSLLLQWRVSVSIKAASEASQWPLALDTLYHLLQRLRPRLSILRSKLHRRAPPPATSRHRKPLLQTVEHLQAVFPSPLHALIEFQCVFKSPLMG